MEGELDYSDEVTPWYPTLFQVLTKMFQTDQSYKSLPLPNNVWLVPIPESSQEEEVSCMLSGVMDEGQVSALLELAVLASHVTNLMWLWEIL